MVGGTRPQGKPAGERGSAGALWGDGGKAASSRRTPKKRRRPHRTPRIGRVLPLGERRQRNVRGAFGFRGGDAQDTIQVQLMLYLGEREMMHATSVSTGSDERVNDDGGGMQRDDKRARSNKSGCAGV